MSILSTGLTSRSSSMPILPINNIQPIHKVRKNKLSFNFDNNNLPPLIQLQAIKDREGEQVDSKIKVIQKRNMKKLEERYDTIDRWRERYVPQSSVLIVRQKIQKDAVFPNIELLSKESSMSSPSSVKFQRKKQKLPIINAKTVKNIDANVADQRQLKRRLEMQLMTRLQRNKRYYEKNSIIVGQNYDALTHKMLKIEHYPQLNILKRALKNQTESFTFVVNPQQNKKQIFQAVKLRKATTIIELKQNLLNEAAEETPQGWQVQNQMAEELNE